MFVSLVSGSLIGCFLDDGGGGGVLRRGMSVVFSVVVGAMNRRCRSAAESKLPSWMVAEPSSPTPPSAAPALTPPPSCRMSVDSMLDRYYRRLYVLSARGVAGLDQYLHLHSNAVAVIGIAQSHSLVRRGSPVVSVTYIPSLHDIKVEYRPSVPPTAPFSALPPPESCLCHPLCPSPPLFQCRFERVRLSDPSLPLPTSVPTSLHPSLHPYLHPYLRPSLSPSVPPMLRFHAVSHTVSNGCVDCVRCPVRRSTARCLLTPPRYFVKLALPTAASTPCTGAVS